MAKSQTQLLTEAVEKLIAHPIAPVAPVLPIAPVAPIAPLDNSISSDLIVKFTRLEENVRVNFEQVKAAIKDIKDGTTSRIDKLEREKLDIKDSYPTLYRSDVEKSIANLQSKAEIQGTMLTRMWSYGISLIFAVGVIEFIINKFL